LSADQFRPAATHAPETVPVVTADAATVLPAAKPQLLQSLNQPLLLQLKLLQLSNSEQDNAFD
jgi:hypothetical protein